MKKTLLIFLSILSFTFANAQNEVIINFNHMLNDLEFAYDEATTVDGDYNINVTRLEYYLSEITITHDGGMVTNLTDVYLLVQPNVANEYSLGMWDINIIESVQIGFGVPESVNNLDPASYPGGHPLAFHNPSMHWGWASGYRFLAVEGAAGDALIFDYEVHALGNNNYGYFNLDYTNSPTAEDGVLRFAVDADYTKLFNSVDIQSGAIIHSATDSKAIQILTNAKSDVFSPGAVATGIEELSITDTFSVYPNPVEDGTLNITIQNDNNEDVTFTIFDTLGKLIQTETFNISTNIVDTKSLNAGIYFIRMEDSKGTQNTKRFIVK